MAAFIPKTYFKDIKVILGKFSIKQIRLKFLLENSRKVFIKNIHIHC